MLQTCHRCGAPVSQGEAVCPNCGAAVKPLPSHIRCKHCHRRVSSKLTVCPHCGRRLEPWQPYRLLLAALVAVLALLWLQLGGRVWFGEVASRAAALLPERIIQSPTPLPIAEAPVIEAPAASAPALETPTATPVIIILPTATDTPTPSPTDTATPTVTPTPSGKGYVVKRGDTLIGIAQRFDISLEALMKANNIADPASLRVGQELLIPAATPTPKPSPTLTPSPKSTPTPTSTPTLQPKQTASPTVKASESPTRTATFTPTPRATATPTATKAVASDPDVYIVQPGDTLLAIAQRVGRSVEALMAYNNITDPTTLRVNQKLNIPPASYTPPPPTPTPKPTPKSTPTPTKSPTPAITLAAPILLTPGDNAAFKGQDALIVLEWRNPNGLPEGVENVLYIGVKVGPEPDAIDWRFKEPVGGATDFRVPSWLFGQAPQAYGRTYVWYVEAAVVTSGGDAFTSSPVSPPSEQRRFVWN
ncbi:MAG: LysM peptidoglycan-binding domain-containing protein [Chloroflexi bacterium]|nr:LysM peptidoglycan-binding domain-containing protein [Chloroflexota bacterium]